MKYSGWIVAGIILIALFIIGLSNQSGNQENIGAPKITASATTLQSDCQSIADSQLRNGAYESLAYAQSNLRPSDVSNMAYYDSVHSTCVFTENIKIYPASYGTTDGAIEVDDKYLYSAAVKSDGVLQDMQAVGWCSHRIFSYPEGSSEDNCVDFQLQQTNAGTDQYKVKALDVGEKISPDEFSALVEKYLPNQAQ